MQDEELAWRNAGNTADLTLGVNASDRLAVGTSVELLDGTFLRLGATSPALAGAIRMRNATSIDWRNAANTADLTLGMDASDRLALAVGASSLTTSATAGTAGAPPVQVATYLTVVLNGTTLSGPHPDIGVVFQQDATFPWLTAEQNVEFGLEFSGVPKAERHEERPRHASQSCTTASARSGWGCGRTRPSRSSVVGPTTVSASSASDRASSASGTRRTNARA